MFLRLRQLCLVADSLEPVVESIATVFGVPVCHRDPGVAKYGLHNALLPFGPGFIEVVAPTREGTTAGRYLERRGGNGGYMVILDSENLSRWREHLPQVNTRIAAALRHAPYEGLQLHPKDTGGALLEINHTDGNGPDPWGPYWPAGDHWPSFSQRSMAIPGATLQSAEPERLARRWAEILQREATILGDSCQIQLDLGQLRFVRALDGRGEGLAGIAVNHPEPDAVRERARLRDCLLDDHTVQLGGVQFYLNKDTAQ